MTERADAVGVDRLRSWAAPGTGGVAFVRDNWPWVELAPSQVEGLEHLSVPGQRRLVQQASAGTGKTALEVWEGMRRLTIGGDGFEVPRGLAFSCDHGQLKLGLKSEFRKWISGSPFLERLYEQTSEEIRLRDRSDARSIVFRSWRKDADPTTQGKSFSGFHPKFGILLGDEVGTVAKIIGDRCEQAMTSCTDGCILLSGNPDSTEGLLYDKSVRDCLDYKVICVSSDPDDPNRSPLVPVELAQRWIDKAKLGRDDPWVRVYVLGRYPLHALNTLVTEDQVREAMTRAPQPAAYEWAAMLLGIDVARFGLDKSIITPRQHSMVWEPTVLSQVDGHQGAAVTARIWGERDADAMFIDDTGGYGGSWIDQLKAMKFKPTGVCFSGSDQDPRMANKRSGMWWRMTRDVIDSLALPASVEAYVGDLATPTYTYVRDRLFIEDGESVRRKLKRSPDWGSSLALTYAQDVAPRGVHPGHPQAAAMWAAKQPRRSQGVDYGGEWVPGS